MARECLPAGVEPTQSRMRNATQREPNTIGSFGLELLDKSKNSTGCRTRQAFLGRASRSICLGESTLLLRRLARDAAAPVFAALLAGGAAMGPVCAACLARRRRQPTSPARPRPHHDLQWRRRQRCSARGHGNNSRRRRASGHMDGGLRDNFYEDLNRLPATLRPRSVGTDAVHASVPSLCRQRREPDLDRAAAIDGTGNANVITGIGTDNILSGSCRN